MQDSDARRIGSDFFQGNKEPEIEYPVFQDLKAQRRAAEKPPEHPIEGSLVSIVPGPNIFIRGQTHLVLPVRQEFIDRLRGLEGKNARIQTERMMVAMEDKWLLGKVNLGCARDRKVFSSFRISVAEVAQDDRIGIEE